MKFVYWLFSSFPFLSHRLKQWRSAQQILKAQANDGSIIDGAVSFLIQDKKGCRLYLGTEMYYTFKFHGIWIGDNGLGPSSLQPNEKYSHKWPTGSYENGLLLFGNDYTDRVIISFYTNNFRERYKFATSILHTQKIEHICVDQLLETNYNILEKVPFYKEECLAILDVTDLALKKKDLRQYAKGRLDPDKRPKAIRMKALDKGNCCYITFYDAADKKIHVDWYPHKNFPKDKKDKKDKRLQVYSNLLNLNEFIKLITMWEINMLMIGSLQKHIIINAIFKIYLFLSFESAFYYIDFVFLTNPIVYHQDLISNIKWFYLL